MPRIKRIFQVAVFCHDCKIVVQIKMTPAAAREMVRHQGHMCEYTVIKP